MSKPSRQQGGVSLSVYLDRPTDLLSLEPRTLLSADGIDAATQADHGHTAGCGCAGCCAIEAEFDFDAFATEAFEDVPLEAAEPGDIDELFVTTTGPTSDTFKLHSNPGATKVIYLDFNGHTTRNTIWNNTYGSTITTPRYDIDGNTGSFSTEELNRIQNIWLRVAEDFIPFNVDVTTQDPGVDNLTNDGDGRYGIRVVIGGDSRDWYTGGGGVAYNETFDSNSDTPAFVFEDNLANGAEAYVAQAISHEVGHTLGLSHDGDGSTAYYAGHGSGDTSWAPIMGLGYQLEVTQWSRGEYNGASNTQDDLAIITSGNGFGYRADDHGSTTGTASTLGLSGTEVADSGIIERNTDFDVFAFTTGAGTITLDVHTLAFGANLDVKAQLLNASGSVIATSNPSGNLNASITKTVGAGDYFLRVEGTGNANPATNGYSDYGSLGQYAITGTIVDSGSPPSGNEPSVSIGDVTVNEAAGTATFVLTLSEASNDYVSVTTTTANGSAKAGSDYVAESDRLTFSPGKTTRVFTVDIINDSSDESNETFNVNLSSANGATIADSRGVGTIIDDDDTPSGSVPSVSIGDVSVNENEGTATFVLTLSEPSSDYVSVSVATVNGSAKAGSDFTADSSRLTFNPGKTTRVFTVDIIDDNADESNETFSVVLSDANGATINDGSGIATIIDDDDQAPPPPPPPSDSGISISNVIVDEYAGTATFVLALSEPSDEYVSVSATTANGSAKAGSDYTAKSSRLTFNPGKTQRIFTVSINNDTAHEGNESFFVLLSDPNGATIADGTGTATVIDDDQASSGGDPTVSISDATVDEDNGTVSVALSLSKPSDDYVSVTVTTANGSATAGSDYTAKSSRLTFNPGKTTRVFTVNINDDSIDEPNESFNVNLSSPTGATIGDGSGTAVIIDDDQAPPPASGPEISIGNVSVDEDAGTATFVLTLSAPSDDYVSVTATTANGSAKAGSDFTAHSQRLTFNPGKSIRVFTVDINNDTADESNESFTVNLSDANNATIADGSGTATIIDDDSPAPDTGDPTIKINNLRIDEHAGVAVFTLTLSKPSADYISVTATTSDGTAKAGSDYTAKSLRLTFSPGKTTRTFSVAINNDSKSESNETFFVNLYEPNGATFADRTGQATIEDNNILAFEPHGIPAPGDPIVTPDHDRHDDHDDGHSAAVLAIRNVLRGDAHDVLDIFKML